MSVELTAYEARPTDGWVIEPAEPRRDWMDQTPHKAANRCLPLVMANQCGWVIRCPIRFQAMWDSRSNGIESLTFKFPQGQEKRYKRQIASVFGSGIITFSIPWLFRTSDGYGLMVRGPTNFFRPDVIALDGLVETDWAPYSFTMNWKVLKPKTPLWFREGDPICTIIPYPLDLLESVTPRFASLESNPMLEEDFVKWASARRKRNLETKDAPPSFQLDYMRGRKPDGERAPAHRTGINLKKFEDERTSVMKW